ncbi:hypothetical protein TorRG33x02_053640 [Trema orientale]|uniref:Uncharacterized protein n=1 Tax=Trema orientale TaxID=63057 RepID=A0A2P5FLU5_TREOI|nr:hypothetical protein TorRG33x02_053640 [Trema orientale]
MCLLKCLLIIYVFRLIRIFHLSNRRNLQVIDMLLFKATEEFNNILEHAKQRHHLIGQYVVGQQGLVQDLNPKDQSTSTFLKNFYKSNYF